MSEKTPFLPPEYIMSDEACERARDVWSGDWQRHLKYLILSGKLQVWLATRTAEPVPTSAEYWKDFDDDYWEAREWYDPDIGSCFPVFRSEEVDREIPRSRGSVQASLESGPSSLPAKSRGGAPTQIDWDDMWIEAICLSQYGVFPETRPEMTRHLQGWFAANGRRAPEETAMKSKMRRLFKALEDAAKRGQ